MAKRENKRSVAGPKPAEPVDDPLLTDLNPEQRRAVTHEKGPLLIVAGAGTGKTMVISRRVARLIATKRSGPDEILALTFTDKAANEMIERIDALLPLGYTDMWVSTFHSFCQRLLQLHGLDIGLPHDFRLLNETDAYLLVRRNFDRFKLDYYRPLGNPTKFIRALLKHFSRAKDEAVHPKEYLDYAKNVSLDKDSAAFDAEENSRLAELANAYHTYQQLLMDNGCLDLGDLLLYALDLFKKRKKILEKYREQFKHVVVDEFQDTNWAQYELLKMLVPRDGNIVVVGDDDQSIYKFRGASVSNILQFKDDFPSAHEVVLTKNYRSLQNILDLSYGFIQRNNPNRLEVRLAGREAGGAVISKKLAASRIGQAAIEHVRFATGEDEAAGVVDRILAIKEKQADLTWNDFCVLVRSNSGAEPFSNELRRRGIPYQFLALKGLYTKPIVIDCLAYFKLLDNYHESPALYRILSAPPYRIDGEDLVRLSHEARKKAESLYETLQRQALLDLKPETRRLLDKLLRDMASHTQLSRQGSVSEVLVKFLYDSGYAGELKRDDTAEAREQASYLNQFLARIRRFEAGHDEPTLRHFMEEFEMERDSGEAGGLSFDAETGPELVRIMTVHAAKGLEFTNVFVVNLVDKRFPAVDRGGEIELPEALTKEIIPEGDIHLEEERRLFYVAMTRAKDGLYLTSAEDYGGKSRKKQSRFLDELGFAAERLSPSTAKLPLAAEPAQPAVPKKPDYLLPKYFSFTQLAAFAKCPLQYKFAHVLKIPIFGKPQFSFGKTIHTTLEKFMTLLAERRAAGQQQLFSAPQPAAGKLPVSRDDLLAIYDETWIDDWYQDKSSKDEYRKKGRRILELFYDRVEAEPPEPLFLEKDFKVKVGSYWLRGKIDRIDNAGARLAEIIDYKTGKSKSDGKIETDDKKQLLLYQIAVSRLLGLKPVKLTYNYLEDGTKLSFIGSDEDLAKFEQDTVVQIENIRNGDFPATPGWHCAFCDFADICEFRD